MVFLSKEGLTESSEKSKNSEINGCGAYFSVCGDVLVVEGKGCGLMVE